MIVVDANLLIYAYDPSVTRHEASRAWLEAAFSSRELIGLPWQSVWAFVRISTHPKLSAGRVSMEQALLIVDQWVQLKQVRLLSPGERHWNLLRQMLNEGQVRGSQVTDAELAALTMEHGGVLYTTDRDFARFPGLRWINPLEHS